jgi:hypothetical protein
VWLSFAGADGHYVVDVAGPAAVVMLGAGIAFPPMIGAATAGVAPEMHGLASGILNTAWMIGGALGLAVLATVAAARTADVAGEAASHAAALVSGFRVAYLVAAGGVLAAGLVAWLLPAPERVREPEARVAVKV